MTKTERNFRTALILETIKSIFVATLILFSIAILIAPNLLVMSGSKWPENFIRRQENIFPYYGDNIRFFGAKEDNGFSWCELKDSTYYLTVVLPNLTQEDDYTVLKMYSQQDSHMVFTEVPKRDLIIPKERIILLVIDRIKEPKIIFGEGGLENGCSRYSYKGYVGSVSKYLQFLRRWQIENLQPGQKYAACGSRTLCKTTNNFICVPSDTVNLTCYFRNTFIDSLEIDYYRNGHFNYDLYDSNRYYEVLDSLVKLHLYLLNKKTKESTRLEIEKRPCLKIDTWGGGTIREFEDKYILEYFWSPNKLIDSLSVRFIAPRVNNVEENVIEIGNIRIPIFIVPSLDYVTKIEWYDWKLKKKPGKLTVNRFSLFLQIMVISALILYGITFIYIKRWIKKHKVM